MQVENLDHLGLVAGIIDELGLVELTDEVLNGKPRVHVTTGQVVKAMLLNCMGFVSAPLYLFSEFFESKPTEHLLGARVKAEHLNDDRLGRALDELHQYGTSQFFLEASMAAVEKFGVDVSQGHLDSTSMAVDGEYKKAEPQAAEELVLKPEEEAEPIAVKIVRGYSRDHRPDLKQFIINLICSRDGGIPLWLKVGNGNDSDSQKFAQLMAEFKRNWTANTMIVVDAAFYSEPNLQTVKSLKWLSRVPQTLKVSQQLIATEEEKLTAVACDLEDYRLWEVKQNYGNIEQRWILIESQSRKADESLWEPELKKIEQRLNRQLKDLTRQIFACKPDAMEALLNFQASLETHTLSSYSVETIRTKRPPGRPAQEKVKTDIEGYQLKAELVRKETTTEEFQQKRSRFILATNQLDAQEWPAQKLLEEYKNQQKVERGFRFLKDPLFFTSSVFVNTPSRVEVLALLMALTLLVYSLAERKLRQALEVAQETVSDQRKKPTRKPTFRWIAQRFQGIHLIQVDHSTIVSNLSEERDKIIRLLGPPIERYYHLFS
jgi:transposase